MYKVGTVIGSSWKGISYMRGRAQSVKNPRTEGQVEQRSKFALTLDFLKPITAYVRTGYKTYATKQTAFNKKAIFTDGFSYRYYSKFISKIVTILLLVTNYQKVVN